MTAGSACTSAVLPEAITLPKFSTTMRRAIDMTSRMSCSMSRTLTPVSQIFSISSESWRFSAGFVPAAGSSSSSSDGAVPSARAISRRRWSP